MSTAFGIILGVLALAVWAAVYSLRHLIYICAPNEVLVFSGKQRQLGRATVGYRIVKGGRGVRVPLLERVDRMDLTNMVIDVTATNAYSKGGVPLTVQGVANVKVAGHEPVLNQAIERFLGRSRQEIVLIVRATLEGSLRGVLSTMTPEEVNEDKILFGERLVHEVEHDLNSLGILVDTLKIQNVQDDVGYLNSIGRKKSAEVARKARIAEANAKAESVVRAAENRQRETKARIEAELSVLRADAARRLADAQTRRDAVVAEERATVAAAVAQARAEIAVQNARIEQVRRKLEADVIEPARAQLEAAESAATAAAAPIVEDGRARAEVLRTLAKAWREAGPNARDVFLLQKLPGVIAALTNTIADTRIEKVTMIDGRAPTVGGGDLPMRALATLEQIKQTLGVDVLQKLRGDEPPRQPPPVPPVSVTRAR
jgi:flotillin